jgi:hypothetical protein
MLKTGYASEELLANSFFRVKVRKSGAVRI